MSAAATPDRRLRRAVLGIFLGIAVVLIAANAHLVFVAFTSQPDCVPHLKGPGAAGGFQAAKSAC
ncbi:MAG TPA: hypothetical protein VL133_00170 [Devosia sp.]|nr:hypothetical protein [Devosia sp.]